MKRNVNKVKIALILLIVIAIAFSVKTRSIINLNKQELRVGDSIKINIDLSKLDYSDYLLVIESDKNRYVAPISSNISFSPPEEGIYRIYIRLKDSAQKIEEKQFIVLPRGEESINVTRNLISVSKTNISIGEKEFISTSLSREEWKEIVITNNKTRFVYNGEKNSFMFIPPQQGVYRVEVRDASNHILASTSFRVNGREESNIGESVISIDLHPINISVRSEKSIVIDNELRQLLSNYEDIKNYNVSYVNTSNGRAILISERDKRLIIPPEHRIVKGIVINSTESFEIKIKEINVKNIRIKNAINAFLIDSNITGKALIKARGRELWKCKQVMNDTCVGSWEKVKELIPGHFYSIDIAPNDPLYVEVGLATFNSEKPFYDVGEKATFFIVTLDNNGFRVDANLSGIITSPSGVSFRINRFNKEELGIYNYSFIVSEQGVYNVSINATYERNGSKINTTINGKIIVNKTSFDVKRKKVLVIDPWKENIEMVVNISLINETLKNSLNNQLLVIEKLPRDVNVTNISCSNGVISVINNTIKINVSDKNKQVILKYVVQPPLKSPDITSMGPLSIYLSNKLIYNESRVWVVALDPSSSTFFATSGSFTGTYSDSGGSYTNTYSDDTSYWYVGSNNNNYDITAWAELTYDLSSISSELSNLINLTFELKYCHDGSGGSVAACDGDAAEGSVQGTQLVQVYNYSGSSWIDIGSLRTDDNGYEVSGEWSISNGLSDLIDANNHVRVRYEMDYSNWWFQDSWLVLDYAPLIAYYRVAPHYVSYGLKNGSIDVSDGSVLTRKDDPIAYALWDSSLEEALIEHTGTNTAINYTISAPYTDNWTNYTMDLENSNEYSHLGRINFSIWAKSDGLWNSTPLKYFYLWSYVTISEISLNPNSNYPSSSDVCTPYWWNSNWNYRRRINISNTASVSLPKKYSINLTIDTTGSKFKNDGNDIRILYYNKTSNKYIELDRVSLNGFNNANTNLWFATVKEIPANSYDDNYYLYYGNPNANSAPSNYSKVFVFFDDFENGNIYGWQNYSNGVISFTTDSNGNGVLLKSTNNDPNGGYVVLPETLNNFEVSMDFNRINEIGGDQTRYGMEDSSFNGYGPRVTDVNPSGRLAIEERSGGSSLGNLNYKTTNYFKLNTWFTLVFRYYNQNMWLYVYNTSSGQLLDSITATDGTTSSFDRFVVHGGYEFYTDNVRVRKFINPEPTTTMGVEINTTTYTNQNCSVIGCRVADEYANPIVYLENYNVSFYKNGSLIGSSLTNSDGWAYLRFGETDLGIYNITCSISADSSLYLYPGSYMSREQDLSVVQPGLDIDPPTISNINENPDPVEKGGFTNITVSVSDPSNVSSVWAVINGNTYYFSNTSSSIWFLWFDTSNESIGTVSYTIYANDSYNNIGSSSSSFTISSPGSIEVNVKTNKENYLPGENVYITTNTTLGGTSTRSNVTTDIIYGNTSYPWWNTSWKMRKPIYLSNPQSFDRVNEIIRVNVSDLNNSISNCNELRIVSINNVEVPFTVENGDNSNWCTIKFIGNVSDNANNELLYFVYYNNSNAPTPSYSASFIKQVFFDDFETNNFADNWVQDSQNDWFRSSQRSRNYGSYSAEVDGYTNNGYIQLANSLDLRGAGKAILSYSWFIETNWDNGESICLDIYDGSWHTSINCVQGNVNEGYWIDNSMNLDNYNMVNGFNIRFRATVSSSAEDGDVDLVNITILYSDISASIGDTQIFIDRNISYTNSFGLTTWIWNSSNQREGLYSVVSLAEKDGWSSGVNYTTFRLLSAAPIVWFSNATPEYQLRGREVNITANVTALNGISKVWVNITIPNGNTNTYSMTLGSDNLYHYSFTNTNVYGVYSFIVYANDTSNKFGFGENKSFTIVGYRGIMAVKTERDEYQGNMNVLLDSYTKWESGDKENGIISFKQESGTVFSDGFENGLSNWVLDNDTVGTITDDISSIDSNSLPHSGDKALYMYSDSGDGSNEQMTATTTLNLAGRTNVVLDFYWAQEDLESDDGGYLDIYDGSWHNGVQSINGNDDDHATFPGDYQHIVIDLSSNYNMINGFQIRFRGVMEGTYNIDLFLVDDVKVTANPFPEESSEKVNYSFGGIDYDDVNDIAITIGVDSYSKQGSDSLSNNAPDLRVGIWNGSAFINYTCNLYNVSNFPYNCTIRVRDKDSNGITTAWETASNRKIFVQGINLDGSDYINYSYVNAEVNTPSRLENYGPTVLSGRLLMQVWSNNSGSWSLIDTIYNDSVSVNAFSVLDIASLWNNNPWYSDGYSTGFYKVYAALLNSSGVMIDEFGYPINDSYIFEITTAPLVTLISPEDYSWVNSSNQVLYFNLSAINPLQNCSLYINNDLNQTKQASELTNNAINNFTVNFGNGEFNWSVECYDNIGQKGVSQEWTLFVDYLEPVINLESPVNNSEWNISSLVSFHYNVSDNFNVSSCSLYINGSKVLTDDSVEMNQSQEFLYNLNNGYYEWWVTCKDLANNTGSSGHFFLTVDYTPKIWKKRWYETLPGGNSYSSAQVIDLKNYPDAPDGSEDSVQLSVSTNTFQTFITGYSPYLGGNGVYIPADQNVTFVGVFDASTTSGYITWKLYQSNSSGDYLICMSGDDFSGGTRITSTSKAQYSNYCNIGSSAIRLGQNDRFKLIVNIASVGTSGTYTHYWDASTLNSYFELSNMYTLSFIKTELVEPNTTTYLNISDKLNVSCMYNCTPGSCLDVNVYLQYNSSTDGWTNIGSSGGLILDSNSNNPVSVGTITNTTGYANFTIIANNAGSYNIRCFASATYSSDYSDPEQVFVSSNNPPNITLNSPSNNSWSNSQTVTFYYTPSSDSGIDNCSLIIDGVVNQTSTSITNNAQNSFTATLSEGLHEWSVNCSSNNLVGSSDTWQLWIDLHNPSVTLFAPSNGETINRNSVTFNFSFIDNLSPNGTCSIIIDNNVNKSGIIVYNNSLHSETINGFSQGVHYWNVSCNDLANNNNVSVTWWFNITDEPPIVHLMNPTNDSWLNNNEQVLYFNVSENNAVVNCSLYINDVLNETKTNINNNAVNNFTINFSNGHFNWSIKCVDDGNLYGWSEKWLIHIDNSSPIVNLISPSNGAQLSNSDVDLTFNVTDNLATLLNCSVYLDNSLNTTMIVSNGSQATDSLINLYDGVHYWNVTCIDNASNVGYSSTWWFNVSEPPTVTLISPAPNGWVNEIAVFTYLPNDNSGVDHCDLIIDGVVNQTDTSIQEGVNNNFTVINMSDGSHTWSVNCTDDYGLSYMPPSRFVFVDKTPPSITLISPPNGAVLNTSTVMINFTVSDTQDSLLDCNITLDGVVNETLTVNSGDYVNRTYTLEDDLHEWNVTCWDNAGNINTSETWNFTIKTPPVITLISPDNNTWSSSSSMSFNYIPSHSTGLSECKLILNGVVNQTSTSIQNGETNTFTVNPISEGMYEWWINCTSVSGVETESEYRILYMDRSAPLINVLFPQEGNISDNNFVDFNFTVTDNLDNELICNFTLLGVVENESFIVNNNSLTTITKLLHDGDYNYSITCWDNASNIGYSGTINFTVEAPPSVELISPENSSYTNNASITLSYRPYDPFSILYCELYIDDVFQQNDTIIENNQVNSFTVALSEGLHNWTIRCVDADNNAFAPSPWNIVVDRTAPSITLIYPSNGQNIVASVVDLNFTVVDALSINMSCNVTLDNNIIWSGIVENNTLMNVSSGLLQEAIHYWNVSCIDLANNYNISETWNFSTINPPIVHLMSPVNDSWMNESSQVLYFNVSDNTGLENCSLYINDVLNETKTNINNNAVNNFTINFSNGHFNWSIKCVDNSSANAVGWSEEWLIHIDTIPPAPFIETLNDSWFNTLTPTIWFNITDNLASIINYSIVVDGVINKEGSVINHTSSSTQLNTLSEGHHEVIVRGIDKASNINDSQPIIIHIDVTAPIVSLISPLNDAKITNTIVELNYSFTDNLANSATCNLYLDNNLIDSRNAINNSVVSVSTTTTYGVHYWNVTCTDNAGNVGYSPTWNFTVVMPDLVITNENISFNTSEFKENENITVFANIFNIGDNNASNFTVEFRTGSINGALISSRNISFLGVNENITINTSIIADLGINNIFVLVDTPLSTNGSLQEKNESNNYANNSFIVSSWHYAYGNTTAALYMYDSSYNYSFKWELPNSSGVRIYAADSDSDISWVDLQALGRDVNNNSVSNDFSDLDNALGSSSYPDNINNTYTINGVPRETESFEVFGKTIDNVPVVNSTNTSSFRTGILWDMSDGNTEFNGSQDVVFVTKVNESQQGRFGVYDFEIRIPAKLRSYKGTTDTITFYTEIR